MPVFKWNTLEACQGPGTGEAGSQETALGGSKMSA